MNGCPARPPRVSGRGKPLFVHGLAAGETAPFAQDIRHLTHPPGRRRSNTHAPPVSPCGLPTALPHPPAKPLSFASRLQAKRRGVTCGGSRRFARKRALETPLPRSSGFPCVSRAGHDCAAFFLTNESMTTSKAPRLSGSSNAA